MKNKFGISLVLSVVLVAFYFYQTSPSCSHPAAQRIKIIKIIPKKEYPFTQGLFLQNNILFESSGLYEKSYVQKKSLNNSFPTIKKELPQEMFAEGITLLGDDLYLISWREKKGMVFSAKDLSFKNDFNYSGEGWGIAEWQNRLYMSDGTDEVKVYDKDFKFRSSYKITHKGVAAHYLNELEFIDDLLFANIWMTSQIVAIDLEKSCVVKEIDASEIADLENANNELGNVLNGIAYDKKTEEIILTGKWWRNYYVVKLVTP